MSATFEELDRRATAMGELVLRRRLEPSLRVDVFEVKLGDEFLMSSLFTESEIELANLALGRVDGRDLDVVVGGLGLGYTARAVLADRRVRSLRVVEALGEVIEWHERGLVPLGPELTVDPRATFVHDDFFALVAGDWLGPPAPYRCHAILVDIDHSPRHVLHASHTSLYTAVGVGRLADRLHPDGVFGLWSDDVPDEAFISVVETVFGSCRAEVVSFRNPLTGGTGSSTVYLAVR